LECATLIWGELIAFAVVVAHSLSSALKQILIINWMRFFGGTFVSMQDKSAVADGADVVLELHITIARSDAQHLLYRHNFNHPLPLT